MEFPWWGNKDTMSNCSDRETQRESTQWPGERKSTDPNGQKDRRNLSSEYAQTVQEPKHSQKKAQEY